MTESQLSFRIRFDRCVSTVLVVIKRKRGKSLGEEKNPNQKMQVVQTKKPSRKKRRLGTLKGKIQVREPKWWKPMSDNEVEARESTHNVRMKG